MNKISIFILAVVAITLSACDNILSTRTQNQTTWESPSEVQFTKAVAIYGDLNEIRSTELKAEPRYLVNAGKVFASGDLLFIGEQGEGIHVFDNSDPKLPNNLYFINIPYINEFYVKDDRIYAVSLYDLIKINMSNKDEPVVERRLTNTFGTPIINPDGESIVSFELRKVNELISHPTRSFYDIEEDDVIYFDHENQIIEEANLPASVAPSNRESSDLMINRMAFVNSHLYIISRYDIFTFKDIGSLNKVSTKDLQYISSEIESVSARNDVLIISTGTSSEIVSINDQDNPQWACTFVPSASFCDPILPAGNAAYITTRIQSECNGSYSNMLKVIDINDLEYPLSKQEIGMRSPYGMAIINDQLYVGEGENGLKIFEINDDTSLKLIAQDYTIKAYEVIPHPTKNDIIFVKSAYSLAQYEIKDNSRKLLSSIPI